VKLNAAMRNRLPDSAFAGPDRSFPIEDVSHARNALSRAHYADNPAAIRAAVHRRYPQIGEDVKAEVKRRLRGGK